MNNDGGGERMACQEACHKGLVTFEVSLKCWIEIY